MENEPKVKNYTRIIAEYRLKLINKENFLCSFRNKSVGKIIFSTSKALHSTNAMSVNPETSTA